VMNKNNKAVAANNGHINIVQGQLINEINDTKSNCKLTTNTVISGVGQYHTDKNGYVYDAVSYADIKSMAHNPEVVPKSQARWIIPSSFESRSHGLQLQRGSFKLLWVDIDKNDIGFCSVVEIAGNIVGSRFVAYTTKTATHENEKMRIIIPLEKAINGFLFKCCQEVLINKFAEQGIECDLTSKRTAQLCYLPNKGDNYRYHIQGGKRFDHYGWLSSLSVVFAQKLKFKEELDARRKAALEKRLRFANNPNQSPIDLFNSQADIEFLLLRYNYLQIGSRWLSPNSSSKSAGVSIKDDRWISSHASDNEIGLSLDSGSCGDAFDLFCYYEHHNDKQQAINAIKQRMKSCGGDYGQ
jgi:hypothetical protein